MAIEAPDLGPLRQSAEYDQTEKELKQIFLDLFEKYLRADERDLNVSGAAHLGSFELLQKRIKQDGLAVFGTDMNAVKYLYRAWYARNPKRGMIFLKTYLQLLWPDGWQVEQMWQDKSLPYPTALSTRADLGANPDATHYLTSRIIVSIDDENETGMSIPRVAPALRSALAARFLLEIRALRTFDNGLVLHNAAYTEHHAFFDGMARSYIDGTVRPEQGTSSVLALAQAEDGLVSFRPRAYLPYLGWALAVPAWSDGWTDLEKIDAVQSRIDAILGGGA